jgi:hypothetical protein
VKIAVISFLVVVLLFQAWVSYRVARSDVYERDQKSAQLTFIWLLPALGAIIALNVLREAEPSTDQRTASEEQRKG